MVHSIDGQGSGPPQAGLSDAMRDVQKLRDSLAQLQGMESHLRQVISVCACVALHLLGVAGWRAGSLLEPTAHACQTLCSKPAKELGHTSEPC